MGEHARKGRRMAMPNYAGLRLWRKARRTGTYVGLYNSEEAGIDGEKWACVCEEHHTMLTVPTFDVARSHLSYPTEWCDACRANEKER